MSLTIWPCNLSGDKGYGVVRRRDGGRGSGCARRDAAPGAYSGVLPSWTRRCLHHITCDHLTEFAAALVLLGHREELTEFMFQLQARKQRAIHV